MRRRSLLATIGGTATASLAGCLGSLLGTTVSESFEDSYEVSGETTLAVTNQNGNLDVEPADGETLTVSGEKRAGSEDALSDISVDVITGEQFVVEVSLGSDANVERHRRRGPPRDA